VLDDRAKGGRPQCSCSTRSAATHGDDAPVFYAAQCTNMPQCFFHGAGLTGRTLDDILAGSPTPSPAPARCVPTLGNPTDVRAQITDAAASENRRRLFAADGTTTDPLTSSTC
jgi:hypothetical protein